jgi:hypothetical protein
VGRPEDAAVERGPPEAASEAKYPEIFMVHDIVSPALAFSNLTLPPGSFPRSAFSRFYREPLGLRPSHWNLASARRPAFRLLCSSPLRLPPFLPTCAPWS